MVVVIVLPDLQVQGWPEAPFIETNAVLSNGLVLRHCSSCGKNGCSGAIPRRQGEVGFMQTANMHLSSGKSSHAHVT